MEDFTISEFEIAIFLISVPSDSLGLLSRIRENIIPFTSAQPTVLPLPADVALGVPRAILKTSDSSFEFQLSLEKINVFHRNIQEITNFNPSELISVLQQILSLEDFEGARFKRIGYITTAINITDEDARFISRKILKRSFWPDLKNAEVALNYKNNVGDREINLSTSISSVQNQQTNERGIQLKTDVNTLESDNLNSTAIEILDYLTQLQNSNLFLFFLRKIYGTRDRIQ